MRIQDRYKEHEPFDVAAGLGHALINQGTHIEIKAAEPYREYPKLNWSTRRGVDQDDYEHPPIIAWSCGTKDCCGNRGVIESQVGTAHKTAKIMHAGNREVCPNSVGEEYVRLFDAWKAKSKKTRRPVEQISAYSPAHVLRAHGVRSREDLLAEAMAIGAYPKPR